MRPAAGDHISRPADVIVADRMTLTGSIGVARMFVDAGKALEDKLGITFDGVRSNPSARTWPRCHPSPLWSGRSSCVAWIR